MFAKTFLIRLLAGLGLLLIVLTVSFGLVLPAFERWGATREEVNSVQPGDELVANPLISWTNGIAIDAPPEAVWPWIAQIGDTRGGFYSYTFIENRIGSLMGAEDYTVVYHNADRIVTEWQNPVPGEEIIQGSLKIREVQPGQWLLADSIDPEAMIWVWLWRLYPVNNGEQTRLVNRFHIEIPSTTDNPVMTFIMSIGGFLMQQNMMQGIRTRAEGGVEPPYIESVEITIWLVALACGLLAAGFYLFQQQWQRPLIVAIAAVLVLFVHTFVQPAIWLRVLLDLLLIAGLWWAYQPARRKAAGILAVSPSH
jgi:hypothetical protein